MAYLSRVLLNPLRRSTQAFLGNPRATHAAILGGLASQPVTNRVLWRMDQAPHSASLIVLTQTRPSWEHLVEQSGWPGADNAEPLIRPYDALLAQITRGREFAFRLTANPTTSTKRPEKPTANQKEHLASSPRPRGVRVACGSAAHQMDWLTGHIDRWGFQLLHSDDGVPAVRLTARSKVSFRKKGANHPVVLNSATFEGLVRVTDPGTAVASLLNGVGTAKAYGFGLITLASPQSRQQPEV